MFKGKKFALFGGYKTQEYVNPKQSNIMCHLKNSWTQVTLELFGT